METIFCHICVDTQAAFNLSTQLLALLCGSFLIWRPHPLYSALWFTAHDSVADRDWTLLAIRILGQFMLGYALAPLMFAFWQWFYFG